MKTSRINQPTDAYQRYSHLQSLWRTSWHTSLCVGLISLMLGLFSSAAQAQTCTQGANPELNGCWSDTLSNADGWPHLSIHLNLLPDGRILSWGRVERFNNDNATIWDRSDWTFGSNNSVAFQPVYFPASLYQERDSGDPIVLQVNSNYDVNLFCAGHTFLPDGRLLVAGGHSDNGGDNNGLNATHTFDYLTNQWTTVGRKDPPNFGTDREFGDVMNDDDPNNDGGRWYPTLLTLPQNTSNNAPRALVAGGKQRGTSLNLQAEIWEEGVGWESVGQPQKFSSNQEYPRMHLVPDGRVFNSGPDQETLFLDLGDTNPQWVAGPDRTGRKSRLDGSSVLYDAKAGKIVVMGGPSMASTEVLDLDCDDQGTCATNPAWREVSPMAFARRQMNATLLPDGTVLATGGHESNRFNTASTAVLEAEIWDPDLETWDMMNPMEEKRIYHSTAILLPDATVLVTGSGRPNDGDGDHLSAQIFYPPYLYNAGGEATQPVINSVSPESPARVGYGGTVTVSTNTAVDTVTLLPIGSVTHALNFNQRIIRPTFSGTTNLSVTIPDNQNVAPPGVYMLFVLSNGVPSEARMIRISAGEYNSIPVVNLDTPLDGFNFNSGASITFTARASEPGTDLSASVGWQDNGANLTLSGDQATLSDGSHNIAASVTGSNIDSVDIAVAGGGGAECGNNTVEGSEVCDGTDLNGETCSSQGFTGGTLACSADCSSFDTSACTGGATCGNGTKEGSEDCDGTDLGGATCQSLGLGFTGGTLACDGTCTFDTSACTGGCGGNKAACGSNADCCSNNCRSGKCRGN